MFNFLKRKPNKMYLRLKNLYKYSYTAPQDQLDNLDKITYEHVLAWNGYDEKWFETAWKDYNSFYFKSKLGTVKIELKHIAMDEEYKITYTSYAGVEVFSINARENSLRVKPNLGENITAADIDLAIFELEEYLRFELGTIEEIQQELERKKRLHKEEVKKLM